jgi:SAM-dependent methyltransferase
MNETVRADSIAALTAVEQDLRTQALNQLRQIRAIEGYVQLAAAETQIGCWRAYSLCEQLFGPPQLPAPPVREIPASALDGFTMGGQAEIEDGYLDATYPGNWPIIYTDHEIDLYLKKIARRETHIYGMTDVWMWDAIAQFPIKGKSVVNMGSLTPWYEANCLYYGAESTTIDYNPILARSTRVKTMTVAEWDRDQPTFDVAWSISSFEHDGLGMYGDPIDPEGDLKAMQKMKRIVKPGGLLFLALPVGRDKVRFNAARVYGRLRLPLLMKGWEQLATFGLEPVHLDGPGHIQPVFVLRNV